MVDSNAVFVSAFHFCHTLWNIHSKSPRLSSCMELEEDNHWNQCGTPVVLSLHSLDACNRAIILF